MVLNSFIFPRDLGISNEHLIKCSCRVFLFKKVLRKLFFQVIWVQTISISYNAVIGCFSLEKNPTFLNFLLKIVLKYYFSREYSRKHLMKCSCVVFSCHPRWPAQGPLMSVLSCLSVLSC